MDSSLSNRRVSVSLDADLIDRVDELADDRTQAIEEAIRLWCSRQTQRQLQRSADLHRQRHDHDETGWLV